MGIMIEHPTMAEIRPTSGRPWADLSADSRSTFGQLLAELWKPFGMSGHGQPRSRTALVILDMLI